MYSQLKNDLENYTVYKMEFCNAPRLKKGVLPKINVADNQDQNQDINTNGNIDNCYSQESAQNQLYQPANKSLNFEKENIMCLNNLEVTETDFNN